jgi:hypothetical protein
VINLAGTCRIGAAATHTRWYQQQLDGCCFIASRCSCKHSVRHCHVVSAGTVDTWFVACMLHAGLLAGKVWDATLVMSLASKGSCPHNAHTARACVLHVPCCVACRQGLGRYAGFELGQRGQLQELFDELGNPGAKRSAGESKQQWCNI